MAVDDQDAFLDKDCCKTGSISSLSRAVPLLGPCAHVSMKLPEIAGPGNKP